MRSRRPDLILVAALIAIWHADYAHAVEHPAIGAAKALHAVTDFGAVGDGQSKCTAAIQNAIDAANRAGGGTVYFHAGTYLSGTIRLESNVTLHLEAGATLLGSTDVDDYPHIRPAFRSYTDNYVVQSLIYAENVHDVAVTGFGTIDGQGGDPAFKWKHGAIPGQPYGYRPYLIRMITSKNIRISDITLRNSAMWVHHYLACDNLTVDGVTVHSLANHNNDGINIDCCHDVRIANCSITSIDDAIVLKSTSDRVCKNVTVTNCVLSSHCNGLKLGTESNGGFENIAITNCALHDVRLAGIALEMVDGGTLDRVLVSNIAMHNVGGGIFLRLGNRARPFKKDMPKPGMGSFRNVVISNVVATGVSNVGSSITGLPGHPIENVTLSNIKITYAGGGTKARANRKVPEKPDKYPEHSMFGILPAYGFYCRHVDGLTLSDVDVRFEKPDYRPALVCDDVKNLEVIGYKAQRVPDAEPLVVLKDVRTAMLRGCVAPPDTGVFLRLLSGCERINVMNNDLTRAATALESGPDVPESAVFLSGNRTTDSRAAANRWMPLFDGKTLAGWHVQGEPDVWRVDDREIIGELVKKSPYAYLCTDRTFGDFELELDMLFESDDGNSGIFFRSTFPPQCANDKCNEVARALAEDAEPFICPKCGHTESLPYERRVHIHGPQAEFAPQNTGGLYDAGGGGWINEDELTEDKQKAHRLGEWNRFRLKAVGDHVTVDLNGVRISDVNDHPFAKQGHIALQLHAGGAMKVRFKDIRIRKLTTDN